MRNSPPKLGDFLTWPQFIVGVAVTVIWGSLGSCACFSFNCYCLVRGYAQRPASENSIQLCRRGCHQVIVLESISVMAMFHRRLPKGHEKIYIMAYRVITPYPIVLAGLTVSEILLVSTRLDRIQFVCGISRKCGRTRDTGHTYTGLPCNRT